MKTSFASIAAVLLSSILFICLIATRDDVRRHGNLMANYMFPARYSSHHARTVWVLSHRRSGTHLTLDLLSAILSPPYTLIKTNHVVLKNSLAPVQRAGNDELSCGCLAHMRRHGRLVHAYRDVRDVVVSMYHYQMSYNNPLKKANITLARYLENEGGFRDSVIEKWVTTTSPLFYEPGIFQLRYTDSVSTMPHTFDSLATFLGQKPRAYPKTTKNIKSPSHAVQRGAGLGEHGFLSVMTEKTATDVLAVAREKELEWRKRGGAACPENADMDYKDNKTMSVWVGKNSIGQTLRLPSFCPTTLEGSIVVRKRI